MGNDGGSIPTRRELVKEAAKDLNTTQVKEVQKEQQEHGWVTCALSQRPLSPPVVSDWSGKLFNKDAVLESLIAGTGDKPEAEISKEKQGEDVRIGSLRDVVEVKFRAEEGGDDNNNENSRSSTRWVCPVTNKTLGPGVKAVYLVPCGHAFAESALKELSAEACLQCDEPFSPENTISILPILPADKLRLKERALRLKEQGLTHSLKKASGTGKKRKKDKTSNDVSTIKAEEIDTKLEGPLPIEDNIMTTVSGIKNIGTASLTARVLAEEQDRNKRRKMGNNENIKGLFSSSTEHQGKESDFMTRGFSIPAGARR